MEESNQQDQKMLTDDDVLEKLQKNKEALQGSSKLIL